ncbi:aspartate-semialdehyde dehydrogenase [Stutzerimonas kirkiae]|uniref:Aspartate-semialdehyde dehydrogenase n=1 Tax=Stutzerimonas kirkiae TaxID=2211392 RepID=A0A4Q9R3U2_9GAMM|nr:aspartate-semialdehyde dehydrogenase [Stutzerimonas kirkiae]TBU94582.1 aspartate-semialdehyde dehydrogenase [Stutzerimonas kirkiae]TBV00733.1 aspartate-semialdehyde dehydrogenase [Stutzerimonas kirkiae]TBV04330.1 aspartate-semialdehyde dehydrogenase [Stutzerimonas kirkiae]TBV12738.1 aspartate-semialdehyde dehydrogenase [Stutzerimonas kirkiae]
MLPPIPSGVIQVTAQQDVPKPRPDIPPVVPAQPSSSETNVGLDQRNPHEAGDLLREEQQRRQRRERKPAQPGGLEEEGGPPLPGAPDEPPRQGQWVDIEV